MMEPQGQPAKAAQRTAGPPEDAHQPEAQRAKHEAPSEGAASPRSGALVGAQPAKLGRQGGPGYPPGKYREP